jgi:OOP family OmpA-OmpF porin
MRTLQIAPLALFFLAATASADGFYGLAEISHARASLDHSQFDGALTANSATGLASTDQGSGNQWRLQGGYRFNENLALELGYIDFGKARYQAAYAGGAASGEVKAGGFDVAALASLPLGEGFSVFGKLGLVAARVTSSLSAGAPASGASGNWSATVVRPLLGVGASYQLSRNVDLRMDYDHVSGLGKSGSTGKMDDNMVSLGAIYNF